MGLSRKGRRWRRPREIVLVDARIAVVALTHHLEQIHRQLQRRQQCFLADLLRSDLIDRRAQVVVRALGPFRRGRAEEGGVGGRMGAGIGVLQLQVGDHRQLIHDRAQRLERGRQLDQPALARRSPPADVASHRHVDKAQTTHRIGRRPGQSGHRGNHGIQQRERQAGAHTAQESPARQCLLCDHHRDFLI